MTIQLDSSFKNQYSDASCWNPKGRGKQIAGFCRIANARHCKAIADLGPPQADCNAGFPVGAELDLFRGFKDYDKLAMQYRLPIAWQQHALDISNILCGEQAAFILCSQLIPLATNSHAREFLKIQALDEARHAEYFLHYLNNIVKHKFDPDPVLQKLLHKAARVPDQNMKLLVCQVIIENLAMTKFRCLLASNTNPYLKEGIKHIMREEAVHASFGLKYLALRLRNQSASQLDVYSNFVTDSIMKLSFGFRHYLKIGDKQGWDRTELLRHLHRRCVLQGTEQKEIWRRFKNVFRRLGFDATRLQQILIGDHGR